MDTRFARNNSAPAEPSVEHVVHLLDVLAAADIPATIKGLEGVLALLRPALAATDVLATDVSPQTLLAALELRLARAGTA